MCELQHPPLAPGKGWNGIWAVKRAAVHPVVPPELCGGQPFYSERVDSLTPLVRYFVTGHI